MKIYNVVDLFCGVGGGAIGLHNTNRVKTLFAVDFWDKACIQYKNHFPEVDVICDGVQNLTEEIIKNQLNGEKVDILLGSPPCQNFSTMNRKNVLNKINNDDLSVYEKNNLFKEFIRCVDIMQPTVVIMENVKGILTMKNEYGELIKDEIIKAYNSIGYNVKFQIIKCEEIGLPQRRHRVIFIATKDNNLNINFPQDNGQRKYIKDIINNLDNAKNHYTNNTSKLTLQRISQIPVGGCMLDIPNDSPLKTKAQFNNSYRRCALDEQSMTVTNICKTILIHPIENRIFTIREGLRLQGFPDDFEFVEEFDNKGNVKNKQDMYLMVANAIPPLLTYEVGKSIIKELDKIILDK